jgi:YD repeat-containing protein
VVTATYNTMGRMLTKIDETGYTLTFEHDDLDRLVKITYPDSTFKQFTYDRLDVVPSRIAPGGRRTWSLTTFDRRKGRPTRWQVSLFDWCRCGQLKSLTDPFGRTTASRRARTRDCQTIRRRFAGQLRYENASSRVRQVINERQDFQLSNRNWFLGYYLVSFVLLGQRIVHIAC